MDKERPLPCPFCGKIEAVRLQSSHEDECSEISDREFFSYVCDASKWAGHEAGGCGAQSGFAPTEAAALTTWNRRVAR